MSYFTPDMGLTPAGRHVSFWRRFLEGNACRWHGSMRIGEKAEPHAGMLRALPLPEQITDLFYSGGVK
jgi:hypothetical protein